MARLRRRSQPGEQICVHGDYDVDGICATALAVLMLREIGADVDVAPAEPLRGGLRRLAADGRAARCRRRRAASSPSTAASPPSRRSRRARRLGVDVIVTDHHRPADDAARLPDRRHAALRLSVPRALRHRRRRTSSPRRCSGRTIRCVARHARPRRARHDRRRRPARRREPGARHRRAARARAHPEAGPAGADARRPGSTRPRSTPPPSASASRRGINAAGRLGRPDVALHLVLTDDAREADLLANELETLNRERQAVEERILREAVAVVDGWPAEASAAGAPTSCGARAGTRA